MHRLVDDVLSGCCGCYFFQPVCDDAGHEGERGLCLVNPPVGVAVVPADGDDDYVGRWPSVAGDDYVCGRYLEAWEEKFVPDSGDTSKIPSGQWVPVSEYDAALRRKALRRRS